MSFSPTLTGPSLITIYQQYIPFYLALNPDPTADTQQTQNPAGADSLSPPTYDSWVQISNHSNPGQTTTPDTGDMSPERDTEGASQVLL